MSLRNLFKFGVFALCVFTAGAQESIHFSSISGRVSDATEAVVDGAKVTARQIDTNQTSALLTDKVGRFRFPYLPGLESTKSGFSNREFVEARRSATVALGSCHYELPVRAFRRVV